MLKFTPFTILLTAVLIAASAQAQVQVEVYKKAVDDINCTMAKKMLVSFERASFARNINDCRYETIVREIKKVQENRTKGYKQDILDMVSKVNNYKTKIDNPSEYVLFETTLDNLAAYTTDAYGSLCNKYAKPSNAICKDYKQSSTLLEQEVADIVYAALAEIGKNTYGGEKAKQRTLPQKTAPATTENAEETNEANDGNLSESGGQTLTTPATNGTGGLASIISTIVLVLLIAAVGWLYKEQQELKEQLEDIKMMLRMFNQKKSDGT